MPGIDSFMADMKAAYQQEKRQQKSNDIIQFIVDHWKLFARSRSEMSAVTRQLGNQLPYTVDALCDALGLPTYLFFKRSPVKDVAGAILSVPGSSLLELFLKCKAVTSNGEACLVLVAGAKSIVITNMQTNFDNCQYDIWYRCNDDEIHIFHIKDAALRLPKLFNPGERNG